jgi:hypothetical protein
LSNSPIFYNGPQAPGSHDNSVARISGTVQVSHPDEKLLSPSRPVQGRGGQHFKRTLASFSLEGNVAVVTGGAQGLGLVMAQGLVASGADVAIVDLNRRFPGAEPRKMDT